ncbi:DUF1189 domain-containing protein [Halalkalibacter sp. APA_J-10(15)]|uniref:DUF1189 domain-containing protein n=1 Tax=Halalkalibacter sp. APA_J-10(15) TaxID=2933805 RepID=UPI001FF528F4|nr:DUF1189 domain-containing protein [Halalkalibacter sp. APA_J-10(15)]MCK0471527.1 DUF1189 domain-containing protein [Halalkalibacter sp. APA_J-10(15)]
MNFSSWFYKSLTQFKVIAYSRFRPITSTIGHVFLFVLIASLPYFFIMNTSIYHSVQQLKDTIHLGLPSFSIENGELLLEEDTPYFQLKNDQLGTLLFDPNQSFSEDHLADSRGIVFSQHDLHIIDYNESLTVSYSLLGLNGVNEGDINDRVEQLHSFIPLLLIIITLFLYAILSGSAYLGITLLAFLALPIRQKRNLEYRHLWSIAAHAITLPTLLFFWVDTLIIDLHIIWYIIVSMSMITLSIRQIPLPRKTT